MPGLTVKRRTRLPPLMAMVWPVPRAPYASVPEESRGRLHPESLQRDLENARLRLAGPDKGGVDDDLEDLEDDDDEVSEDEEEEEDE